MLLHRVLVVDDHEPFRRALCALLQQRTDVLIAGEAADGFEAIRRAEALRPDVVMLDIHLPMLSGIEVARRIRALLPDAKLMFVTNEPSLDVVEQAFGAGAHGYVYKPRAQRDVLPVLEATISGARFVSAGLERIARGDSLASHRHHVLFFSSDAVFVSALSRFIAGTLHEGSAVVALVTELHDESLRRSLAASADFALAVREGRYVALNITELLSRVVVYGQPSPMRFLNVAEDAFAEAARRATRQHSKVAACGECSAAVWAQGHVEVAIQLEHLWDEVARSRQMDILCAYPIAVRQEKGPAVRSLCAEHTAVEIS